MLFSWPKITMTVSLSFSEGGHSTCKSIPQKKRRLDTTDVIGWDLDGDGRRFKALFGRMLVGWLSYMAICFMLKIC